jgi:hypothetical protein
MHFQHTSRTPPFVRERTDGGGKIPHPAEEKVIK